ncbi:MAG TPA: PDZ domain-containing protein [Pyrinomonadaceae bacterium]|nr:PDZ domain-containing protein [Pyrinomonadaceae bacterium]
MFRIKTLASLALLFTFLLCAPGVGAQEAQSRRSQTDGAYAFAFGGNHLGVSVESVTRENMNNFNLRGEPRGVAVREVAEGGPAAKAGLQKNDVILRFDGEQVSSVQKLQRLINESAPEHTARLSVSRNGAEQELSVKLGRGETFTSRSFGNFRFPEGQAFGFNTDDFKRQAEELTHNSEEWKRRSKELQRNSEEWKKRAKELQLDSQELRKDLEEKFRAKGFGENFTLVYGGSARRIGITTQTLTDQLADYFGVGTGGGLLVTSVVENSPAAKAGLKAGDVVTEVDGARLKTAGELARALNRKDEGDVTITVMRDRKTRTLKVTPDRSQHEPTFLTPNAFGTTAPIALIAPRTGVMPRPAMPARPVITPLVAPRAPLAPRIYATPRIAPAAPLVPLRPGVWVL